MSVSKARRAELEAELLKTMDRLDALKVELREALADHRDQVKLHATKLKDLRDILSGRESEQTSIPGTEAGAVKPPKARRAELEPKKVRPLVTPNSGPYRPKGELTRWAADARARKVPTFVIEMTGLKAKAQVVAKYGDMCVFEKGKPCPMPIGKRPGDLAAKKPARVAKSARLAPGALIRWGEPDRDGVVVGRAGRDTYKITPYPDGGWRWECPGGGGASPKIAGETLADTKARCEDRAKSRAQDAARAAKSRAAEPAAPHPISWTEGDGTLQVVVGTTTYRAVEISSTRWVLESKSERERAWHKEIALDSQAECEAWIVRHHSGVTFAEACLNCGVLADQPSEGCLECQHGRPLDEGELDSLVGSRDEAVKRHGKEAPRG